MWSDGQALASLFADSGYLSLSLLKVTLTLLSNLSVSLQVELTMCRFGALTRLTFIASFAIRRLRANTFVWSTWLGSLLSTLLFTLIGAVKEFHRFFQQLRLAYRRHLVLLGNMIKLQSRLFGWQVRWLVGFLGHRCVGLNLRVTHLLFGLGQLIWNQS